MNIPNPHLSCNFLTSLLIFGLSFTATAQYVTIPDSNFRARLQQFYPVCFNGNGEMDTTCAAIVNEIHLVATSIQISNLEGVQYFDNLQVLDCEYNQLTTLPEIPQSLIELYCFDNRLTSLPELPNSVRTLYCSNNEISTLPALPQSLLYLVCNDNQLTTLPDLPSSLVNLYCADNQLTSLPELPQTLTNLQCQNNQLTSLPPIPTSIYRLYCNDNQLTCIPILHNGLILFNAENNPAACVPNVPPNCTPCQNYPLCDADQICLNNFAYCSGKIFLDLNGDGAMNNNETNWPDFIISSMPGDHVAAGTYSGYRVVLDTNATSVVTPNNPYPNALAPSPNSYIVVSNGPGEIPGSFDFALRPLIGIHDLEITMAAGVARPGFNTSVYIRVFNAGVMVETPILNLVFPTDWVVLNSSPQGIVSGDSITWQDTTLTPFHYHDFYVQFHIPAFVPIGTPYSYTATAPLANDVTPDNNISVINQTVRGSYDPNDKACNTEQLNPGYDPEQELFYTVRFQNTGNDTAFTVVVRDTLSTLLRANTLRLVNASHRCDLSFMDNLRALSFIFPAINLVDSFANEPLSHGFVQYAIKPQPNLPIGTVIENTADIYFDYNAPVRTNTVATYIGIVSVPNLTSNSQLKIYPNPTDGHIRVETPGPMPVGSLLVIGNMMGQTMLSTPYSGNNAELSLSTLPSGVYSVALVSDGRAMYRGVVVKN